MEDHELITDLGDEQLHVQAARARGHHGHLNGLIGHIVRTGDADPAAGVLDHGGEEFEVVVVVEAGPAGQDLAVDELRVLLWSYQ